MIQGIVAGTLAALNSIIAPLGSGQDNIAQVYRFDVKGAPGAATACMTSRQSPKIQLKLEDAGEFSVRVRIKSQLCGVDRKLHSTAANFVLPLDVFDNDFLSSLGEMRPYIITGVNDPEHPRYKSRLKITRMKPAAVAANLNSPGSNSTPPTQGFLIEWVPSSQNETPEHPPLTFWLKKANPALAKAIESRTPQSARSTNLASATNEPLLTFPWERFAFTLENPIGGTRRDGALSAANAATGRAKGDSVLHDLQAATAQTAPTELSAELHVKTDREGSKIR